MNRPYLRQVPIGSLVVRRSERGQQGDPLLAVSQSKGVTPQEGSGRRDISSSDKSTYWRVYPGDLVYNTMRMWQGASARSDYFGIVSPAYTVCEPLPACSSEYLEYLFKMPTSLTKFRNRSQGITSDVWNLRFLEFRKIRVDVVDSDEARKRIVETLSTVDDAIAQTEALIAKSQQIKAGLMHDLFTRGLTANGKLRPPREEAPDLYKQSSLGWIPKEWEVLELSRLSEVRSGFAKNEGRLPRNPIVVKYLRVANVQDGFLHLSELKSISIAAGDLEKYRVEPGDVLMNEGGDRDKLGRGTVWSDIGEPCIHQNHVFVVRPGPDVVPAFLALWTCSQHARRYFMNSGKQTTNLASINKTMLGRLPVPVPNLHEQIAAVNSLNSLAQKVTTHVEAAAKLRSLKSALMHDLLTGRVRVPVPQKEP